MKRNELKAIVKECLIEILAEGLQVSSGDVGLRTESPRPKQVIQASGPRRPAYDPRLDEPVNGKRTPNPRYKQAVREAVTMVTDDPLMRGIFADTVKTLQSQDSREGMGPPPSDAASRAVANANPEEMFSGSERWASLAFMDGARRNSPAES